MEARSLTPPRTRKIIENLYELSEKGYHYIMENQDKCHFKSQGRNISGNLEKLSIGDKFVASTSVPEPFISMSYNPDDPAEWGRKWLSGDYLFLIKHPQPPSYFYDLYSSNDHVTNRTEDEKNGGILLLPRDAVDLGYITPLSASLKKKSKSKKHKKKKKNTKRKKKRKSKQRRKSKMR